MNPPTIVSEGNFDRREMRIAEHLLKIWWVVLVLALAISYGRASEKVTAVGAIGMTVADMNRSVDFYTNVLTFQKVSDTEVWGPAYEHLEGVFGLRMRVVRMRLGAEMIELTEYLTPRGKPFPADTKSNDRWFQHIAIVVSDMDKAYDRLRQFNVQHASTAPQTLPPAIKAAAGIRAFYFRDPDGHFLEVIWFPADKGDRKWKTPTDRLFLGIDHTAIVVGNSEESLRFYHDRLGMNVAGESVNYGTEQEHLNNVFGARLHITGLRAASGPGIEFLEYLAPRDGRITPAELRPNDIAHWQTTLMTADADSLAQSLLAAHATIVSGGTVSTDGQLGYKKGFLVLDPDGHTMSIVQSGTERAGTATSGREGR